MPGQQEQRRVVSWPKCLAVLPFILQVSEHNGQLPSQLQCCHVATLPRCLGAPEVHAVRLAQLKMESSGGGRLI